jgi:hypothetical protein
MPRRPGNRSYQRCIDTIRQSAPDLIDEDQAEAIIDEIVTGANNHDLIGSEEAIRQAGRNLVQQTKALRALTRRNALLSLRARKRIKNYVKNFPTPGEGLHAFINGTSKIRPEGRFSVHYQAESIKLAHVGQLINKLDEAGVLNDFAHNTNEQNVMREIWELTRENGQTGVTGDESAVKIAEAVTDINSRLIDRQNRAGAYINKRKGYIMRQQHDPDAIRRAGGRGLGKGSKEASFEVWKQFIMPLLDMQETFGGTTDADFIDDWLRKVHEGIVTGVHGRFNAGNINGSFGLVGSLAKRVSQPRILHFKDADAFYQYNQAFGLKNFRDSIISQIRADSHNIALMENFGPNPRAMFSRIKSELKHEYRSHPDDLKAIKSLDSHMLEASFKMVSGELDQIANPTIHSIGFALRALTTMGRLGGVTLSAIPDKAFLQLEASYQGISNFKTLHEQFRLFKPKTAEERQRLRLMGAGLDGFLGSVASRFSLHDKRNGTLFKLQQKFFQLNMMNAWNDAHKSGMAHLMASNFGELADLDMPNLPDETKRLFLQYGISQREWNIIRKAKVDYEGHSYITPDQISAQGVEKIPDVSWEELMSDYALKDSPNNRKRILDTIETKYRTMLADRIDIGVPTPGNWERTVTSLGTQTGTIVGDVTRMLFHFKSFPITVYNKILRREIYGHGSESLREWLMSDRQGNFRMLQLIAVTTIGGYMSGVIKDLLKGRTPKDPTKGKTILEAMQRGGGMGILGDFMFTEYDRSYRSFMNVMAGPVLGTASEAIGTTSQAIRGENVSMSAGKLALANTPYINLFYIRPVLDYLILWNLQENAGSRFFKGHGTQSREDQ